MNTLLWIRPSDMRVDDHPALHWLASQRGTVTGLFVLPSTWTQQVAPGFARVSGLRQRWLLESLIELQQRWTELGGTLIVTTGDETEVVPRLAQQLDVQWVAAAPLPATEELATTSTVFERLQAVGISLRVFRCSTLLDLDDLPFTVDRLPQIFTQFRKAVEQRWRIRPPVPAPAHLPPAPAAADVPTLDTTQLRELANALPTPDPRSLVPWNPGEAGAHARLHHYFWQTNAVRDYKETRNGLTDMDDATRFSPWLAHGSISARTVQHQLQRYEAERGANESTYWVTFELLWRDYFHFWSMKHGARLFQLHGVRGQVLTWHQHERSFRQWTEGHTGRAFVDAAMVELRSTGYTSNRMRQVVASAFAKGQHLDWRWGARWFESQLIDYDPCSNWGNWQYVSGVGNDPRDRTFNVDLQAQRYDPDGAFVRRWL
jgi:deoxyribodipyrimidine photo-lyase